MSAPPQPEASLFRSNTLNMPRGERARPAPGSKVHELLTALEASSHEEESAVASTEPLHTSLPSSTLSTAPPTGSEAPARATGSSATSSTFSSTSTSTTTTSSSASWSSSAMSSSSLLHALGDSLPTDGFWLTKSGDSAKTLGMDLPWAKKKRWFTIKDARGHAKPVDGIPFQVAVMEYYTPPQGNGSGGDVLRKGEIPIMSDTVPERRGNEVRIPSSTGRVYRLHAETEQEADVLHRVIQDIAGQLLIWDHWTVPYEHITFEGLAGAGAFGEVWKGILDSPTLGKHTVAVKKLKSDSQAFDRLASQGFIIEGTCMRSMKHPNVVKFFGAGYLPKDEGGMPYLVTEFADRGTLRNVLSAPEKICWELRFSFATDITRGLEYMHSRGCIHRDVKSDNILIFGTTAKLSDFGTSKRIFESFAQPLDKDKGKKRGKPSIKSDKEEKVKEEEEEERVAVAVVAEDEQKAKKEGGSSESETSKGSSLNLSPRQTVANHTRMTGTPLWMAPEVFSRKPYGQPSDIFSLGMVFQELATCQVPWFGENIGKFTSQLEDAVVSGRRPAIPDECPPAFAALIQQCWAADPSERPSTSGVLKALFDLGMLRACDPNDPKTVNMEKCNRSEDIVLGTSCDVLDGN